MERGKLVDYRGHRIGGGERRCLYSQHDTNVYKQAKITYNIYYCKNIIMSDWLFSIVLPLSLSLSVLFKRRPGNLRIIWLRSHRRVQSSDVSARQLKSYFDRPHRLSLL